MRRSLTVRFWLYDRKPEISKRVLVSHRKRVMVYIFRKFLHIKTITTRRYIRSVLWCCVLVLFAFACRFHRLDRAAWTCGVDRTTRTTRWNRLSRIYWLFWFHWSDWSHRTSGLPWWSRSNRSNWVARCDHLCK